MPALENIPANIITGFLGAGKTTAILHFLGTKPAQERWAILVNEFGKVGVDGIDSTCVQQNQIQHSDRF